ncbi:hypothetical protein ABFB09_05890 [Dehalogenimonas sp. THU2]|uniref:hypothetical protein n=1 Tax=Dehalogenimonas sp. THU2 TaxID=3151121 RepID=UPI00321844A7
MADKYSYKQGKKKKSPIRMTAEPAAQAAAPARAATPAPAAPAAKAAPIPAKSAAAPRAEKQPTYSLDLGSELKRVGMIGGSLLVVLVAASLLF